MNSKKFIPHASLLGDLQITMHAILQQKLAVRSMLQRLGIQEDKADERPSSWVFFTPQGESGESDLTPLLMLQQHVKEFGKTLTHIRPFLSEFYHMPKLTQSLQTLQQLYTSLPFITPEVQLVKNGHKSLGDQEIHQALSLYLQILDKIGKKMAHLKQALFEEMIESVSLSCQISSDDEKPSCN